MDSVNLKTASTYVNNLLLARGLLRNGKPIQFARPQRAEGGTEQTLAQIINLVHDMILKRDREQEQRETLAQTIRTLRIESTQHVTENEQLKAKVEELNRQLTQSQTKERAATRAAKSAESNTKALREELAKLKSSVSQVRAACANDVRKRDLQIQKLKTHLSSQQRGNRSAATGMTIVIQPGASTSNRDGSKQESTSSTKDLGYSLKEETNNFLTQLSQTLSDENDNLISLVRSTLITLKELQGLPENAERLDPVMATIPEDSVHDGLVHALPVSYQILSQDMETVLDSLRGLLTNPNFVSIDEVAVREEEILKLREGWEKMEQKWAETIFMMNSWCERIASGDDTINLDEIKKVLGMGKGLNMPIGSAYDATTAMTDTSYSDEPSLCSSIEEEVSMADSDDLPPPISSPIKLVPEQPKLTSKAIATMLSPRKVALQSPHLRQEVIVDTQSGSDHTDSGQSSKSASSSSSRKIPVKTSSNVRARKQPVVQIGDQAYLYVTPHQSRKRSSSPEPHEDDHSNNLTVQEKLNVAQAEAEAAAVAAGLKLDDIEPNRESTATKDNVASRKLRKTGVSGRPRRRKSTLTPDELEKLMFE